VTDEASLAPTVSGYANPILPGFHPDPSICRVGRDFYLVTSSFEYFPGVPIFHSRNLVDWRPIGHVLTRARQLDLTGALSSSGIYAPTLRHHEGTFYVVTTLSGRGNFVVTAPHARGPWSDPIWIDEEGIDPSLAFLDGRIFYTRNGPGRDPDHPFHYQAELGRDLTLVAPPRVIWKGTGGIWPEAPHLYRREGFYYLVTAEGGTSYGHSVVVARSRRPYGQFRASPHGPLITHRERPRDPVQATGHADFVEAADGTTWMVLLGIRPTGGRHHHLGRETFLAPVTWGSDGWPRLGGSGRVELGPPAVGESHVREDFDGPRLPTGFVFVRNPRRSDSSLRERPGQLRLWGAPVTLRDVASPALVCHRQQHLDVTVATVLDFEPGAPNEEAGICVRASDEFHVALLVGLASDRTRELRLVRTLGGRARTLARSGLGDGPVTLEIRARARRYTFLGGTGGRPVELGGVATRALSAETILARTRCHHFTGAMIGLYATGNGLRSTAPADFDWLDYRPG
jgi:xylan 1,4-beta-xylosidase